MFLLLIVECVCCVSGMTIVWASSVTGVMTLCGTDALHGRNMRHRMDAPALRINSILRSKWYSLAYALILLLDLLLALVELPSTFRPQSSLNRRLLPLWATSTTELLVLLLFAMDVVLRYRYMGERQFRRHAYVLMRLVWSSVGECIGQQLRKNLLETRATMPCLH